MHDSTPTSASSPAPLRVPPRLANGTYTVQHPEKGHFTIRLQTARGGALAGKRILSLLTGPNNDADYTGVAFWDDERGRAVVWSKFRGGDSFPLDGYHWGARWSATEKKIAVFLDLALRERGYFRGEGATLEESRTCLVCNRTLTTPESIERGIGPECAAKQ